MTRLIYFAWVRERIGKGEEEIELDPSIATVADLLSHLKSRGDGYAAALEYQDVIRVAINQEHVDHDAPVRDAREIALFPPMTGG
ncbi:molybdopterin converting factor subunit 1 [Phyllobacterium sp. 21LDTY02-6]|jgi:sulfur-carrier protein|uniref:molybdopterin converting factor subunit 1 n=1 Tax=unclassified Phyllobacterium TaxID=2638441 RepID=UPI0020207DED|nr:MULTISPECIES: molybdopterin converting factor subunit 1 [unclassified Phyllobacterium]MCO4319733.1 molybdopterin converting factor subunit 1 [Phyllobacterium sp. 21LDTY02-6]MCX8280475.1 molybdopterin converting factor subunit 1 [Phyllobacterium sp. 0TCS1.6C]MCX8295076.1 molybdopterin converting factor subunit 1 [Phyllobacterium sp. 0TCS1.6A]